MGLLLLGIDSFIACVAIGAIVDRRWRLPLAAMFGVADAAAFLIGAGLGWTISAGVTEVLEVGTLGALGLWLVVVAAGTRRVAELWPLWVLPLALTMDNLAYGVASDYSGSLLGHAAEQAVASSLLAFAGLYVASVLPRALPVMERRAAAYRFAGAALLLVTTGFVLLG
jgi:putative Mn2+ efflux pump MntP